MKYVNYYFLEAGHGKGAADGVGGILKRTADILEAHGRDLHNTDTVFTVLEVDTSFKLFKVSKQDVSNVDRCLPSDLKTVPGTLTCHQIVATKPRRISCRKLLIPEPSPVTSAKRHYQICPDIWMVICESLHI